MQNLKKTEETVMWSAFKILDLLNILLLGITLELLILHNILLVLFSQYQECLCTMQAMFTEANAVLKIK